MAGLPSPTTNVGTGFEEYVIKMRVLVVSANLWQSPYSPEQTALFDKIKKFHDVGGWNFKVISDWLNDHGYLTPRGKTFTANHAWSIYQKKNLSIKRFSRTYPSTITDLKVESGDYFAGQPDVVGK